MTRDARANALRRVPLRPNLDLINHKPKVRVPEDRPRSQDRVIRRWQDGSLDYGTALYAILDAVWKLRDGGHLTPIEAALLSVVIPGRKSETDPAVAAVTLGRLSEDEKRRLGDVAQKLEQIAMASTQQVLARSVTDWDLAGVREHMPTLLVNDPYGLGTAERTMPLAKGVIGSTRPQIHGDLHVARFHDALKTAQAHHQSGNYHGAHAALQVAGQALSQVPDEHTMFTEPQFPARFQHMLSLHRDVTSKLGTGSGTGQSLQNAIPRIATLVKAYPGDREGEGTRGGVVMGHRPSGEPIYQSQMHRLAPELQRLLEQTHAHAARSDDPNQRAQAGIQALAAAFFHHHAGDGEAARRALTFAEHHQGRARGGGHDSPQLAWLERHLPAVRSLVGPHGPGTISAQGHVVRPHRSSDRSGADLQRSLRTLRAIVTESQ